METSFEVLIETHRQALERAALKFCHGDFDLAQDMVQDTFVKALKNADRFSAGTNLRAWLMRILYNTVMSVYRHRQVAKEGPYPEGFDPEEGMPADLEVSDEVLEAVSNLPDDYRKVFLMAALETPPTRRSPTSSASRGDRHEPAVARPADAPAKTISGVGELIRRPPARTRPGARPRRRRRDTGIGRRTARRASPAAAARPWIRWFAGSTSTGRPSTSALQPG
jgi:RNA polymerase sigma-70 factor (ECF subfamily)